MFRFCPSDIHKVRYFGIDTASILRALAPCWRLEVYFPQSFDIGRFGIAIDARGHNTSVSQSMPSLYRSTGD